LDMHMQDACGAYNRKVYEDTLVLNVVRLIAAFCT